MNVILEGPDGGGKSTLAAKLGKTIGARVQVGNGPPRNASEIEGRMRDYNAMLDVIFDRHPCVSQPIYGALRGEDVTSLQRALIDEFYGTHNLFIYCRATSVGRHAVKAGEDPQHIAILTSRYAELVTAYDVWALTHANVVYRIGDDVSQIVDIVRVVAG